jgi:hypothetical protein
MKKILFSIAALGIISLYSCKEAEVDQATIDTTVNEKAAAQIASAEAEATKACEARMEAEVKHMTDSMVHEAQMAAAQNAN